MTEVAAGMGSHRQTARLFRRYADGDIDAREELVTHFLPVARRLAARYPARRQPREDLEQVAAVGLLKAIDRYEASEGHFLSYAVPSILGELKRHFRDRGWAIRVDRVLQERVMAVDCATEDLTGTLGRSPTACEIAEATGLSTDEVAEAIDAARARDWCALDAPLAGSEGSASTLGDGLGAIDRRYELFDLSHSVAPAVAALPERERAVLHLRFVEDLTQAEIGRRIGCSQMQVSRLIRRSLDRLARAAEVTNRAPA